MSGRTLKFEPTLADSRNVSGNLAADLTPDTPAEVFIGRQPIFDAKLKVIGSELLYRDSEENNAVVYDQNAASSTTIVSAFLEFGIDSLVGDGVAYLNLPRELLLSNHLRALPKDKVVLEVLEHVVAEPRIVAQVRRLKAEGFKIALDDFVYRPDLAPLVALADVIKVEVLDKDEMHGTLHALSGFRGQLLAEKVEDQSDMEICRRAGFHLFQGYFLCRPVVNKGHRMPHSKLGVMRMLVKLHEPNLDTGDLEAIVRADVSLSFRLLRYLNSAHFSLPSPIHDVRQALALLGVSKLRAWVSMIAIASMDDNPRELVRIAMVRARMCELLASYVDEDATAAFTTGLFSVLDALLDEAMDTALVKLPLRDDINRALLAREGPLGVILRDVMHHEAGQWAVLEGHELSPGMLTEAYLAANSWAYTAMSGV